MNSKRKNNKKVLIEPKKENKKRKNKEEYIKNSEEDLIHDNIMTNIENVKKELTEKQNLNFYEKLISSLNKEQLIEFNNKYHVIEDNIYLRSSFETIKHYPYTVNGLLFIGDPHFWSKTPGRRLDNYKQTILNKLTEAINYANENNLLIICLGDLFERPDDNNIEALTDLIEVLKKSKYKIITAVGNHDINEYKLTKNNPLKMLEMANVIELMEDNGFYYNISIKNKKEEIKQVLLGSTPYGFNIPDNILPLLLNENLIQEDKTIVKYLNPKNIYKKLTETQIKNIEEQEKANKTAGNLPIYLKQNKYNEQIVELFLNFKKENNITDVIWITHHDLAMNGAYPNSIALKEILGIDMIINGHIHGTKQPVKINNTVYYNTGNIARTKIDMFNHKPAVWKYDLDQTQEELIPSINGLLVKQLIPFYLNYKEGKDVFKLTGKHVNKESLTEEEIINIANGLELNTEEEKVFASLLLKQEEKQELNSKTDDGTFIKEALLEFIKEKNIREDLKEIIFSLCERSLN